MTKWVSALWLAASLVHAQTGDLVQRGVEARARHDDAAALALFEEAYRVEPLPSTLAQIALAEQALGRWAPAHDHLSEALRSDDPWVAAQRATLEHALALIAEHAGFIEVLCTEAGASLTVDGRDAALNTRITVRSGDVLVIVQAPNRVAVERHVQVQPGRHVRESVEMATAPPSALSANAPSNTVSPRAVTASGPNGDVLIASFVGYGVGALGGIATILFGSLALAENASLTNGCGMTSCTLADIATANTLALVSDISLVTLLAGAATGTVLLAIAFASGGSRATAIVPWITPHALGLTATGAF